MPKYLISASYTVDGLKGLEKETASGRQRTVAAAVAALGGKLDCLYYALGEDDVYLIVDMPDNASAGSIGLAFSATGRVRTRMVEVDTESYHVARSYMIRLEMPDFEEPSVGALAAQTKLSAQEFKDRFLPVVEATTPGAGYPSAVN